MIQAVTRIATVWRVLAAAALVGVVATLLPRRLHERGTARTPEPTAVPFLAVPPDSAFTGPIVAQHRVGDYVIRIYVDTVSDERIVEVARAGRRAFAARAASIELDHIGRDITGDGVPDLVVTEFTGGMHCCTLVVVLGLGDSLRVHGTIDGADGEVEFEDLDRDGVVEARLQDWRFAYWRDYPFVETQAPEVILRFRNGSYGPACDLMRKAAPDSAALAARARELRDHWEDGDPPADLYGYAVDLVYQGHADLAWLFLDVAWPPGIPGKADFIRDLRAQLSDSPCWSEPPSPRRAT